MEINVAMKTPGNGWKENLFTHVTPNACTSFKQMMGNQWKPIMNAYGIYNTSCPLLPV